MMIVLRDKISDTFTSKKLNCSLSGSDFNENECFIAAQISLFQLEEGSALAIKFHSPKAGLHVADVTFNVSTRWTLVVPSVVTATRTV